MTPTDKIREMLRKSMGPVRYSVSGCANLRPALDALCDHHDAATRALSHPEVLELAKRCEPEAMVGVANAGDRIERIVSDG